MLKSKKQPTSIKRRTPIRRGKSGLRRDSEKSIDSVRLRRRLNALGKQGKLNRKANAQLAKEFKGPRYCEATFEHECTGAEQLTWAHNAKRRKKPDLLRAALLCRNAHNIIEVKPPEVMKAIVDGIVAARETALPNAA